MPRFQRLVAILVLTVINVGAQTTWVVNAAAAPPGNGSALTPFTTLQAAVNASSAGDTILVLPGTYTENVVVPRMTLTIVGSLGSAVTVLDGMSIGNCLLVQPSTATPAPLTIQGLRLTNGQPAGILLPEFAELVLTQSQIDSCVDAIQYQSYASFHLESSLLTNCAGNGIGPAAGLPFLSYQDLTMLNSSITHMGANGCLLHGSFSYGTNSTIAHCSDTGLRFLGPWASVLNLTGCTVSQCGTGVYGEAISSYTNCTISNCVGDGIHTLLGMDSPTIIMSGCTVSGNGGVGLNGFDGLDAGNCSFSNNGSHGVAGGFFGSANLGNCMFEGNGGIGLVLTVNNGIYLNACSFTNNVSHGATASGAAIGISTCTSSGNGGDGITTGYAWGPATVQNCTSFSNGGDGIRSTGSIDLVGCQTYGNAGWGMRHDLGGIAAQDVSVHGNNLGGITISGIQQPEVFALKQIRVESNQGPGIVVDSAEGSILSSVIANNVGSGLVTSGSSAQFGHLTIHGNGLPAVEVSTPGCVMFNSAITGSASAVSALGGSLELINCLVDAPLPWVPEIQSQCLLVANPLYMDPVNGNFELTASSPAIDAGVSSHPSVLMIPLLDVAGQARILGTAPDIGANESTASVPRVCVTGSLPVVLGETWELEVHSSIANAPLVILADVAPGSTPLAPGLVSQLAFSPSLVAITAPIWSPWGTGFGVPQTDANGSWSVAIPIPVNLSALPVGIWIEAFVLDTSAPNGIARQSNLLPVTFSVGGMPPQGLNIALNSTGISAWNRTAGVGDLNNDGILDLATTSAVWRGTGLGGFHAQPFGLDPDGIEVELADFNNDGFLDLLTMDAPTNPFTGAATPDQCMVFFGNGSGQYTGTPSIIPLGSWDEGRAVSHDLNGDGYLDVVVAAGLRASGPGLRVFLSSGGLTPTFVASGPGIFSGCRAVAVGDLNGDTLPDLVAEHSPSSSAPRSLHILFGNGTGQYSLQNSVQVASTPELGASFLDVHDLNGDGILEIIWASQTEFGVLSGSGSSWTYHQAGRLGTSALPYAREATVAVLDLNKDGSLDLVAPLVGGSFSGIAVSLSNGSLSFPYRFHIELPSMTNPMFLTAGDIDSDGDDDLLIGGSDLTILRNNN